MPHTVQYHFFWLQAWTVLFFGLFVSAWQAGARLVAFNMAIASCAKVSQKHRADLTPGSRQEQTRFYCKSPSTCLPASRSATGTSLPCPQEKGPLCKFLTAESRLWGLFAAQNASKGKVLNMGSKLAAAQTVETWERIKSISQHLSKHSKGYIQNAWQSWRFVNFIGVPVQTCAVEHVVGLSTRCSELHCSYERAVPRKLLAVWLF